MSDARPLRPAFAGELEQLRLQVELLAVRVDENLERMRMVLERGDLGLAELTVGADDAIDAMSVSLTERCYDVHAREQPVAGDLRLVVSVLRVVGELERIGDLSLRVVKLAPHHAVLRSNPSTFGLLGDLADAAISRYRAALRAWSASSVELALEVVQTPSVAGPILDRLTAELVRQDGSGAAELAVHSLVAGKSLERIADHAEIIATRLLFLLTGDPGHLAHEVR